MRLADRRNRDRTMTKIFVSSCLAILVSSSGCMTNSASDHSEIGTNQFRKLPTETARLKFAIDAIDAGLLKPGTTASDVDRLFGTKLTARFPDNLLKSGTDPAVIFMHPAYDDFAGGRRDANGYQDQESPQGWWLDIEFNGAGVVQYYYLSNVGGK
jgi:hypothetical protein